MKRIQTCLSLAFLCLFLCMLAACKHGKTAAPMTPETPAGLVEAYLDQGRLEDAKIVVLENETFFKEAFVYPEIRELLDRFANDLEDDHKDELEAVRQDILAIKWPAPKAEWRQIKISLNSAEQKLEAVQSDKIFQYVLFRSKLHALVERDLRLKRKVIRKDAPLQFESYALSETDIFFDVYPVTVNAVKVLQKSEATWSAALATAPDNVASAFMVRYGAHMPKKAKERCAEAYFLSLCPNPKTAPLKDILAAFEKCQGAGLSLKEIPGIKIGFLQVTSPKLLQDKAIDFGVNVKVDVPFDAKRASMRKMFSHKVVQEADILVLMSVAMSRARRVVERRVSLRSTYVNAFVNSANPEYDIVRAELQSASEQYHAAQSRGSAPWPISLLGASKEENVSQTGERMDSLKEKLRATPKIVSVPSYQPYDVIKAHMDIYKFATVNYYIVDKRSKSFFEDTFDIHDKKFFTVCYDLHSTDPNREKFLQTSVLEEDVARHELTPVVVNLSDLLGQYVAMPNKQKHYANMGAVHRAVVKNRNVTQRKYDEQDFGYDKYYDKRFDSVVIVRNLGSGIGTGFYVTDNLVLTNYHVVEENEYVRLGLFDKRDTIGRVIARDMYRDLALIQADIKKKPVCFYNQTKIPQGVTLEAIGHPVKYPFSITRGVMSMVRKASPINLQGQTNRKILYIQTDAALNGGNSGGPLFYGDYVVGVNDWSHKAYGKGRSAEGLHFAIHYSEVFKFLEQHGVEVCKGSE